MALPRCHADRGCLVAGVSVSTMQQHLMLAAALRQQLAVWSPRRILLLSVSQCNQVAGALYSIQGHTT